MLRTFTVQKVEFLGQILLIADLQAIGLFPWPSEGLFTQEPGPDDFVNGGYAVVEKGKVNRLGDVIGDADDITRLGKPFEFSVDVPDELDDVFDDDEPPF